MSSKGFVDSRATHETATRHAPVHDPASDHPSPPIHNPESNGSATLRMPVDIRSAALTVLAGLGVVLVLQYAQAMIIPIVLALLISYALEPVVA